jgi:gas vesicle protein
MAQNQSSGGFLAGLIIGGVVGAALAVLLAPQSGEEIRSQLREKGQDWQHLANESIADTRAKAEAMQAQAKEAVVKAAQRSEDAAASDEI